MNDPRTEISFAPPILLSRAAELAAPNRYGVVDVSPDTVRWMKESARMLESFLGDVDVCRVVPRDIANWQAAEEKRGVRPSTTNSRLRGLKTLWSRLQRNGSVGQNPAEPIRYLPEPRTGPKAVSEATYRAMRDVADVRDRAILDTLWGTGCRLGGLISMNLDELEHWLGEDGEPCYAVVVREKGKERRHVYLKGEPARSLNRWVKRRPVSESRALFLTRQRTRCTGVGISHVIRRLRMAAGIGKGTPANAHGFRHAFAIRMLDEGYDLATVSQWLGHHSPEFTAKVYCVRSEEQLRWRYFSKP